MARFMYYYFVYLLQPSLQADTGERCTLSSVWLRKQLKGQVRVVRNERDYSAHSPNSTLSIGLCRPGGKLALLLVWTLRPGPRRERAPRQSRAGRAEGICRSAQSQREGERVASCRAALGHRPGRERRAASGERRAASSELPIHTSSSPLSPPSPLFSLLPLLSFFLFFLFLSLSPTVREPSFANGTSFIANERIN